MKYYHIIEEGRGFNPAEAEEGFSRRSRILCRDIHKIVSIQPKPKKGLVETVKLKQLFNNLSFNPAEAEEGFSRAQYVDIQRIGLSCFNPAEAEEGFSRIFEDDDLVNRLNGFNPAEAEEGFSRKGKRYTSYFLSVSIQPKPKKGLVGFNILSIN